MWNTLIIPIQYQKRESAAAILLQCPSTSRWDGWRCWFPKKLVKSHQFGDYRYLELSIQPTMTLRFSRYVSRYQAPLEEFVTGQVLIDVFRDEHELSSLRFEHQARSTEADRLFEQHMQGTTRPSFPHYFNH